MATIKLQNGKVITKSGKVSCTCCGGGECCMYPAQALADGLYTINDLPDEIVVQKTGNPITLQRGIGFSEPPQIPGAFYGSSDPNGNEDYVFLYNGFWEYGPGVPVCSQAPCLITDLCAKDQFADTYTVTYSYDANPLGEATFIHSETVTVTRQSLCAWRGTDSCGNPLWLEIVLFDEDKPEETFLSWAISFYMYRTDYSINATEILCNTGSQGNALKQGFQNTPLGNYKFAFQNLVVS